MHCLPTIMRDFRAAEERHNNRRVAQFRCHAAALQYLARERPVMPTKKAMKAPAKKPAAAKKPAVPMKRMKKKSQLGLEEQMVLFYCGEEGLKKFRRKQRRR